MPISEEQFAKILQHNASTINQVSGAKVSNNNNNMREFTGDAWDNFSLSEPSELDENYVSKPFNQERLENSKIPDAIKESMVNNPIDTSSLSMLGTDEKTTAFLNRIAASRERAGKSGGPQIVSEQKTNQQQYVAQPQPIDYSMIKMIVSECIREYFKESNQLNENKNSVGSLKQISISKGKIDIVDSKGRMFTANLEYKGNINDEQ